MAGTNVVFLVIGLLIFYLVIIALAIASYVITSIGVYRLASRYQVDSPWMAWLPVVRDMLLGRLTEVHDARNGAKRKWGTLMLVLSLANIGGLILFYIIYIAMFLTISAQTVISNGNMTGSLGIFLIVFFIVAIALGLCSVAYMACNYICMYKNMEAIAPNKTIKYFLLSILVPFAYGIILMKCCKKGYIEPMGESAQIVPRYVPSEMTPVSEVPSEVPQAADTSATMEKQDTKQDADFEYSVVSEDMLEEE